MAFLELDDRLCEQPIKHLRKNTVQVLIQRSELEELLKSSQEEYVIHLELKFTNSGKEMYLKATQNKA